MGFMGCMVCHAAGDGLFGVGDDGGALCKHCAARIARLVLDDEGPLLAELWRVAGPINGAAQVRTPENELEVSTHVELARAYEEMGLHVDALGEAALALLGPCRTEDGEAALAVLFDAAVVRPQALTVLTERLRQT